MKHALVVALLVGGCGSFGPADTEPNADAGGAADGGAGLDAGVADVVVDGRATNERLVFATSATFTGKLGASIAEIDGLCTSAAAAAGLGGSWVAWVSTAASNPLARLAADAGNAGATWKRVDGVTVFVGTSAFTKALGAPINRDEHGLPLPDSPVWTATNHETAHDAPDCAGWTSAAPELQGSYGTTRSAGTTWTNSAEQPCTERSRLYCFER